MKIISGKKIVFTWEWGAGNGHLRRFLPIALELQQAGHEVVLIVRDVPRAQVMYAGTNIRVLPIPLLPMNRKSVLQNPQTFVGLAWNLGAHDADRLGQCVVQWKALFEEIQPTHVISDFGLLSGFVASAMSIPLARIGLGFYIPPSHAILKGMFGEAPTDQELNIIRTIQSHFQSQTLRAGLRTPNDWQEIFPATGPAVVTTVAEFDPFSGDRDPTDYVGTWSAETGIKPEWPNVGGFRTLAYLKSDSRLVERCEQLAMSNLNILLVCDGPVPDGLIKAPNITLANKLFSTDLEHNPYELILCNASHGLTIRSIELGLPVIMFPLYIEHRWNARVVEKLGLGIDLSKHPLDSWGDLLDHFVEKSHSDHRHQIYSAAFRKKNDNACLKGVQRILNWLETGNS